MATLFILSVPAGPSSSVLFLKEFLDRLIPMIQTEKSLQPRSHTSPINLKSKKEILSLTQQELEIFCDICRKKEVEGLEPAQKD